MMKLAAVRESLPHRQRRRTIGIFFRQAPAFGFRQDFEPLARRTVQAPDTLRRVAKFGLAQIPPPQCVRRRSPCRVLSMTLSTNAGSSVAT